MHNKDTFIQEHILGKLLPKDEFQKKESENHERARKHRVQETDDPI